MKTTRWDLDLTDDRDDVEPCELCGPSFDELTVEFYHDTGELDVTFRIGCTGGEGYNGKSLEDAVAMLGRISGYGVFSDSEEARLELGAIINDLARVARAARREEADYGAA